MSEELAVNSISISELDELQANEVQDTDKLLVERDDVVHSLNVGNIREVLGVELNELEPSISQGAVNTNPAVSITPKSTDASNHRRFNIDFTIPKANQIESTTVTQNNNDSGTSNISVELSDGSTKSLDIKNGKGISSITEENNTANGATRAITVNYSDGTTNALSVKNGEGIDSVTVNQSSSAGATSTMTIAMSNGTTHTLAVKNGKDFHIAKSYASIAAMEADFANMEAYDFVMIDTGSVEDVDTGKLYYKGTSQWEYVGDLSGKQGIKGDTGVGIASLSFSESQESSGINVLTVTLTDETTQTFNIRNGAKGDTGERGTGVFAGTDYRETGTSHIEGAGETICDEGFFIDRRTTYTSYKTSYKAGDIYIQTVTNDVLKAVETEKFIGNGISVHILYWQLIGNIQGMSIGSIIAPSTLNTSPGAGNEYTVLDTDGNAIGIISVFNPTSAKADTLTTARSFTIADADGTNSGISESFDGSGNVTLHLPSTAKIDITGNAATATTATNATTATSATSADNAARLGGLEPVCYMHERTSGYVGTTAQFQEDLKNNGLAGPSCGSYCISDGPVGDTWYNYIYIPHRQGISGDNNLYGTLLVTTMVQNTGYVFIKHYISGEWLGWQDLRVGFSSYADKVSSFDIYPNGNLTSVNIGGDIHSTIVPYSATAETANKIRRGQPSSLEDGDIWIE